MRIQVMLFAVALTGCEKTECAEGTIERDGTCEPADLTVGTAKCGANTKVVGDQCLPVFDPTVCDPSTTDQDRNVATNVTTCVAKGGAGGGCGAPIACPQPSIGMQTICGQLYNMEDSEPFTAESSTGVRCDPQNPTASGPCALRVNAYDAIAFASNPATTPLSVADTYVDDCGRFRLSDIMPPSGSPFIALGTDDRDPARTGTAGVTNAAGVATATAPNMATKDVEAFVVPATTTTKWAMTGGPPISSGIYVMIFRQKRAGTRLTQAGVTVLKGPPPNFMPIPSNDHYFVNTDVQRERVDSAAGATGANGTALVTNAMLSDIYTGTPNVLPAECRWSAHAAQTVPGVVFVQILRPVNAAGMTCNL
ncbi:MAG TPA: hypothetical protein VK427_16285 [Kofleriaceae bacterium]|nr:hypothetical protein [Kofleriaceae bacterium]